MAAHLPPGAGWSTTTPRPTPATRGAPRGYPTSTSSRGSRRSRATRRSSTATTSRSPTPTSRTTSTSASSRRGRSDRLDLREVVTRARVLPGAPGTPTPSSFDDFTQISGGLRRRPRPARGATAPTSTTRRTPSTRARGRPCGAGQTASWFFGESLRARAATVLFDQPADPGHARPLRDARGRRDDALGSTPVRAPRARRSVIGPHPGGRRGRAVGPGRSPAPLPAQQAVITVGRACPTSSAAHCRRLSCPGRGSLAGFSQGYAVFTLRRPPEPIAATTATGRRASRRSVLSSTTKSEQVTGGRAGAVDGHPLRGLGLGMDGDGVGQRRARPRTSRCTTSTWCNRSASPPGNDVVTFHYRPPHLLAGQSLLSLGCDRTAPGAAGCAGWSGAGGRQVGARCRGAGGAGASRRRGAGARRLRSEAAAQVTRQSGQQ